MINLQKSRGLKFDHNDRTMYMYHFKEISVRILRRKQLLTPCVGCKQEIMVVVFIENKLMYGPR